MSKVVGVRLNLILGLWWVSISSVAYDFFFLLLRCVFFSRVCLNMYCGIILWNYYIYICSLADLIYISLCSVVLWSPAGGKHARMVIFISHDALGSPSELHP